MTPESQKEQEEDWRAAAMQSHNPLTTSNWLALISNVSVIQALKSHPDNKEEGIHGNDPEDARHNRS